jgi:hypothetical protein
MNDHALVRRSLCIALLVAVVATSVVFAQQIWVGGRGGMRPRWPQASDFDGGFMYCRAFYRGGWSTDYPGADHNFSVRLAELTRVRVKFDEQRNPHHIVVSLADPLLFRCPIRRVHAGGSRAPSRVLSQGRLPVGRRLVGIPAVAAMGISALENPGARRVSDR